MWLPRAHSGWSRWAEEEGRLCFPLARFYHRLIAVRLEPCLSAHSHSWRRYRGMTVNKIPEVPTIRLDSRLCHIAAGTSHLLEVCETLEFSSRFSVMNGKADLR